MRKAVIVRAAKNVNRDAFLDAAYRLMDRAWVRVGARAGVLSAVLTPRGSSGAGLAAEFKAAYASAAAARRAERGALQVHASLLSRALVLADQVDARRREPMQTLSAARLAEISALLAEDEASPLDPLGLRVPWEELHRRKDA